MDNTNLATVIADKLISSDLISKQNFDETVELVEEKLAFHLGDDRNALLEQHNTTNETTAVDSGDDAISEFHLKNKAVAAGTMTGQIYRKSMAIQSFFVDENGQFGFSNVGQPSDVTALAGKLNAREGKVTLSWNTAPGDNYILVSYDYFKPEGK